MTEILTTVGAHTLGGGAAIVLLVLASRAGRDRIGAKWRCLAWLLLCLRLAIPIPLLPRLQEAVQAPIQIPTPPDTVIYTPPAPSGGGQSPDVTPNTPPAAGTDPSSSGQQGLPSQTPDSPSSSTSIQAPNKEPRALSAAQFLFVLWLAGATILLLCMLLAHLRFLAYLRRWTQAVDTPETVQLYNQLGDQLGLNRRPNLMVCPELPSPMLAGIFRPVLLLPETLPEGPALRYTLLHELIHYRRRDILLKTLALWVNALHWFNPLVWYMVRLVERDTELACDEASLRLLPVEEHKAYGRTILDAAERKKR